MNNHIPDIGVQLASHLGLSFPRREGHDLAGACIACNSSDAFRLHQQTGVGHCFSCSGKWSPFQIAETVFQDRERAKALMVEMGIFEEKGQTQLPPPAQGPLETIARQKGVKPESLKAFGAVVISVQAIELPAYGPDGQQCTTFSMRMLGGKGLFAKGKKAGLFFPHENGMVRLPQPGEVWYLVEGPKDAAALWEQGLLACGMNTCRLAAKFARLFAGVEIVLIPDRDRAGEEGGQFSARVLRGVAQSVRIAVLPAEFKESQGEDVRDILRRPGGRELLMQVIEDAQAPEGWDAPEVEMTASADIPLPEGEALTLEVWPTVGKLQRVVRVVRGEVEHRDRLNSDSSSARERFAKKLAAKIGVDWRVVLPLIDGQITKLADEIDQNTPAPVGKDAAEAQSQATQAVNMIAEWELWHTPGNEAFATVPKDGHHENWAVRSQLFKRHLQKKFFDETGKAIGSEAITAAINVIESKAMFDGEQHSVFLRVAEHEGNIFLDLCNADWQVVQITPNGWQIVSDPPVRFRRSKSMMPMPTPQQGGSIELLRPFLNIDNTSWILIVAWLVGALRPRGPYPVLALFAEQGSGKSTAGRILRFLVDPNAALLRAEPRDGRDLMIAANNSWVLAFDNLSHIPSWLSDCFCRISTGGGYATRELYSDMEEVIFDSQRPILLTSIEEVATRSDLLDRCLAVWLAAIAEDQRRSEAEIFAALDLVYPKILGALLDAVSTALRRLPSIKVPGLPRMADFALWVTAAETSFGWREGTFMAAYRGNRQSVNDLALEGSVLAVPLLDLLEANGGWTGAAADLLEQLEQRVNDKIRRLNTWPKNPNALSGRLKRLAPNLRKIGWEASKGRTAKNRMWVIQRVEVPATGFASPSASLDHVASPIASSNGSSKSLQDDADCCQQVGDDAGDANDANSGLDWNRERY